MSDQTLMREPYSVDTNTMPWTEFYVEELKGGFRQTTLFQTRTPACRGEDEVQGWIHQCLASSQLCAWNVRADGTLRTHAGSFGPGSLVWFPEGMEMEHGATQDNDVTLLFITNKPFDTHYTFEDEDQKEQCAA